MSSIVCLPIDPALWPGFDDGWRYDEHPGDCHSETDGECWTTCCRECAGTGVWPVPWIATVEQGRGDDSASCVSCKGTGRAVVCLAAPGCDRTDCERTDVVEVVHFNPNIVRPLYSDRPGWRHYRYCAEHARAVVAPES